MPKRASILFAVIALALTFAACGGNGATPSQTPTPVGTLTPNPKDRSASVDVTILNSPAPKVAVEISTPKSSASPRPGKPFDTQITDKKGVAVFKNLNPSKTYCWVANLTSSQSSSTCAPYYIWQTGPVTLGT
ncbi:MAG TPA: hypothetical protein VKB39_08005 [Candidatus Baltobacteraceae bacterium]|nr:hypothetical protein [Candidatus Baltobacteraceae bacterium]